MPIPITCPGCAAKFTADDQYAGKRAKCPKCRGPIVVPSEYHYGDTVKLPNPLLKRPPADPDAPPDEPTG